MRPRIVLVLGPVVGLNLLLWTLLNRPVEMAPWQGTIRGVSFSPYQKGQDPYQHHYPTAAEIDRDLEQIKESTASVRTYSSTYGLETIPTLAARHGLRVTAGAWLDTDRKRNEAEIQALIHNARTCTTIDRLVVGNETILRGDLPVARLADYLDRVRRAAGRPVSTAEPWHVWLKYPELARHVDYIMIHVLPYWEGVPNPKAVDWVLARLRQVEATFPDKPVIIGEVGWPSDGERFGKSRASLVNQARFVREFLNEARAEKLDYFIMEAFDQPWKKREEGVVGRHWGLFDVDRQAKFSMTGQVTEEGLWPWQAALATLFALIPLLLFGRKWHHLRMRGLFFFAGLLQLVASLLTWTLFVPFTLDLTLLSRLTWGLLLPAQVLLLAVILVNGLELTELLWPRSWRRRFVPAGPETAAGPLPRVSLHLAIHNEPPAMVRETLESLARLDYPDYEVLVVDNNTRDEQCWRPVEACCAALGPRFRFFHLPQWPGFKAGALNYALARTDPGAEIVGIIDSDYVVAPDWLRCLVPHFAGAGVGFVQAPQDNRDWKGNGFKEMCNWEYNGFFRIGMVQRNERNAIIQHGTMTLIRREALEKVGRWGEWCICEDAELGLRLLAAGYESVYVDRDFGHGLTPDTFSGYKGQRFRWVFGAAQILRRHWRPILTGRGCRLTFGQRFHFATGWLPWLADGLHLLFALGGVFWTLGILVWPQYFEFPLGAFLLPVLGICLGRVLHTLVLYRARVRCGFRQRLGAALAGLSLTHVIARGVLASLTTNSRPFLRTPKCENRPLIIQGLLMAREEAQLMVMLLLAAAAVLHRYGTSSPEALLWGATLGVQALPYAGAVAVAIINLLPELRNRSRHLSIRRLADSLTAIWPAPEGKKLGVPKPVLVEAQLQKEPAGN